MSDEERKGPRGVAAELVVVFVGVLLALAADDFREARSERSEAQESLALLLADLRSDSTEFAGVGEDARRVARSIAWLSENWDRSSIPIDSLEVALYAFSSRSTLQLSKSAYAGLENANLLRLVEPDSLRQSIRNYYQNRHSNIELWKNDVDRLTWTLIFENLGRHVINPGGAAPGDMWPPSEGRVRLRTSWPEIQADADLHNVLIILGRVVEYYGDNILSSGEVAASELMAQVRLEM